jgi:DJ-1 family protein
VDIKILVPVANGSEDMETVIIVDMLRRSGIQVKVAGENEIITCSRGIKIIPDLLLESIVDDDDFDAIIIPGGDQGTFNLNRNEYLQTILKRHKEKNITFGAICSAPTILVQQKIAEPGCFITSHPSVKDQFNGYNYVEEEVVEDGNIITSRGAGTSFAFALHIIEKFCGAEIADKVSNDIVLQ